MTLRISRDPFKTHYLFGGLALVALLLVSSSSSADATSYRCTDRNGKPLLGNGPPSNECVNNICTFTNGIKKCESESALEPEENSRSPQAELDHQQWLTDIALLERYPTEERIEADGKSDLQPVRRRIADAERRLKAAVDERQGGTQNELDFHSHGPIPLELDERMKSNALAQEEANGAISEGKTEEKQIGAKYDDYVKRFRALKKKMQKPCPRPLSAARFAR